jgi:hypothetical protein
LNYVSNNTPSSSIAEYAAPGHIKAASITSPEAQVLTGPKMIAFLNGIISLVDVGLNDCYSGFGEDFGHWCDDLLVFYDPDEYSFGQLKYLPTNPNNAANIVNELSLLLTGGRLSSQSKQIIRQAFQSEGDSSDGLRLVQKLIAITPEFHTSSAFCAMEVDRPELEASTSSDKRYKAVSSYGRS